MDIIKHLHNFCVCKEGGGVKYHRLKNGMFIILSDMKDHMLDNVPIDQQPVAHYTSDDMHCEKL